MTNYNKLVEHANGTDEPETVAEVTSTEGEPKTVKRVLITSTTNAGYLKGNVERETLFKHLTAKATVENFLEIPVNSELEVGDKFKLTLENKSSGTNAEVYGLIEYEIR